MMELSISLVIYDSDAWRMKYLHIEYRDKCSIMRLTIVIK